MVYKLAHEVEIGSLPFQVSGKLYDHLLEFLLVLDNEYGADRNVEQDDGGYVLFCTPDTTDSEIQRYFDFNGLVSDWVMFTGRSPFTRQSGSVFNVAAAREAWSEMITQCEADKLVFLDESGVNTDLSRRYGRAIGGERFADKTPLNTPANTTILSSIPHCTKGILSSWIICARIMSKRSKRCYRGLA